MSLDARGEVVSDEQISPLVHDEALETTAASKEIAGKSPTAIAFSRLRKDKVASPARWSCCSSCSSLSSRR